MKTAEEERSLNLAIIIPTFPPGPIGGAELQAQGWAERLSAHHRVTVITRRDPASLPLLQERDGYTIRRFPRPKDRRLWRTAAEVAAIGSCIGAIDPKPDLLLCFMTFNSGLAGVLAGRRLDIPAVVWIRSELEYRLSASPRQRWIAPWVWKSAAAVLVQSDVGRADLIAELESCSSRHLRAIREGL